jgi:hypothetical protein
MTFVILFLLAVPQLEYCIKFWVRLAMRLVPKATKAPIVYQSCQDCPSKQPVPIPATTYDVLAPPAH